MPYPDFSILGEGNSRMINVDNNFQGWYYYREEYLTLYGEPSDSELVEFNEEATQFEMQIDLAKPEEVQMTDIIKYYHSHVDVFSLENTRLVVGMIIGCLKNDNSVEADLIARTYLKLAEYQKLEDLKHRDDTDSGPMNEYPFNSHAYAVCKLLNIVLVNLKGDYPRVIKSATICSVFFAELLEEEEQNG